MEGCPARIKKENLRDGGEASYVEMTLREGQEEKFEITVMKVF